MKEASLSAIYRYIDSHLDEFLDGLKLLISQPTISTQGIGVRETADLLRGMMEQIGIKTQLIETPGAPVVFGEIRGAAEAPTILTYGHYDVQPPDPLEAWESPPFEPTIRDGRIYARGAADNKGQLYAQLIGVKAHIELRGHVPVNVKFIFEGEEESGSPNLDRFVMEHRELLKSDFVYTSDGPVHESGRPIVVMGVRGILYVELVAKGANRDLHSGNWGGPMPNAAWRIIDLLTSMRDSATGRVLIEGFHEHIRPPSEAEKDTLQAIPLDRRRVAEDLGLKDADIPEAEVFNEMLMFQPTLNICGFSSGYVGRGMKTVIPSTAMVKMDMRLVADQDPDDIFEKLLRHVKRYAPDVEVRRLGQMRPSRTPLDNRYVKPITEAVREATREDPILYPSLGGSLPDYVFTGILGVPSIMVPYGNFDEKNHAPNENFKIENFMKGIRCYATVLERLSQTR